MNSSSASLNHQSSSRVRMALILGTLSAFGPLSLDMYLPALPTLAEDFNSSPSYAQLSLTACMVGLAAGSSWQVPLVMYEDVVRRLLQDLCYIRLLPYYVW